MGRGNPIEAENPIPLLRSSFGAADAEQLYSTANGNSQSHRSDRRECRCRRSVECFNKGNGTVARQASRCFGSCRNDVQTGASERNRAVGRHHRGQVVYSGPRSRIFPICSGDG
jgi:hypothetical protein